MNFQLLVADIENKSGSRLQRSGTGISGGVELPYAARVRLQKMTSPTANQYYHSISAAASLRRPTAFQE